MSRQIDLSQPLSPEDRQYLVDRADTVALERNAAAVAGTEFAKSAPVLDPAGPVAIEDMTVDQLEEGIRAYNERHKDEAEFTNLSVSGNKEELQIALTEAIASESPEGDAQ